MLHEVHRQMRYSARRPIRAPACPPTSTPVPGPYTCGTSWKLEAGTIYTRETSWKLEV